ncbi:hypothetical protein ACH5RR_040408 [Cinchona calisaya]|uniref:Rx N-terminal domain-containing protein n=1 Tax=Cinchona calisaya TaxID=153742 RepID=A0ABD2XRT0_9GENT
MAETICSFVLDNLSIFLREEDRLLGGLRQEVQRIKDELRHLRAFLKVAEPKENDEPRLPEWIKQVREAAYDTEDVLDDFVLHFARQCSKGFYGSIKRIFKSIKNLWIAERFVERKEGMNTEDAAKDYLKELVNRSLIQVTIVFYEGVPWTCRIHYLLR